MLKIFGYAASINVRKVLWLCEELSIPFEREDWTGGFRSTSEPLFRKLSPVGMVPVIDDGGLVIWESNFGGRGRAQTQTRNFNAAPAEASELATRAATVLDATHAGASKDVNALYAVGMSSLLMGGQNDRGPRHLRAVPKPTFSA